jgi:rabenosyn-5
MSDSGSPSQSPAVRYKTYQSKRASTSSLSSIQGALFGPDPVKAASEPFVRPATPENKALLVNKPTAPSPLARPVNPSTSSLDRFPSPPLGSRPFASIQQAHLDDHSHRLGSPAPIRTASTSALPSPTRPKGKAPYLAGFQPQGVYRPRTDEFAQARDHYSENKRLERARISRRLEKVLSRACVDTTQLMRACPAAACPAL